MSLDLRVLTEAELPAAESVFAHAFGMPNRHELEDRMARVRERFEPEWYLGAFEGEELTSMMRIIPNEMYINGALISFGTVSPVANSPLHRRKGHTGALLRYSLGVMRDRGQPLSGLYTPHPAFYRRYGWEIASHQRTYRFKPKDLELQAPPAQRGSFKALRPDDLPVIEPVYAKWAARGNGTFLRNERWWRGYVLEARWRGVHDIVLWQDDAGEPQGYAVFLLPDKGPDVEKVVVVELVALTGDAYTNLLAYFGRYDLHREIVVHGSPHEALPLHFMDTERLEMTENFSVLVRINDFQAAMTARPPARTDESAEITLKLEDRTAPWNDGNWRVAISEGQTLVERTDAEPDLTVSERILAPLYNGHLRPSAAHEAGLLLSSGDDALERADRVFAVRRPPFFPDHF